MGEEEDLGKTISLRVEEEKIDRLDHLIDRKNVKLGPGADERISRSGLLRGCIDSLIEELEGELDTGNRRTGPMTAAAD